MQIIRYSPATSNLKIDGLIITAVKVGKHLHYALEFLEVQFDFSNFVELVKFLTNKKHFKNKKTS